MVSSHLVFCVSAHVCYRQLFSCSLEMPAALTSLHIFNFLWYHITKSWTRKKFNGSCAHMATPKISEPPINNNVYEVSSLLWDLVFQEVMSYQQKKFPYSRFLRNFSNYTNTNHRVIILLLTKNILDTHQWSHLRNFTQTFQTNPVLYFTTNKRITSN